MILVFALIESPSFTSNSLTTPLCVDGTSIVVLSVSILATTSSTVTASPTFNWK
jgi:hypothetical protein